jgi:DNA-binding transcriptional LysR family regulator
MDLRQLEYVDRLARTLNFTRAAEELHVAQPALSRSIAKLEEELGCRLFERTSRSVKLTDAGVTFVAGARRILAQVKNLSLEMGEFGHGTAGVIRISTWYHLEPMLPALLHDFIVHNPNIEVSIVELVGTAMLDALRSDEIDFGVAIVAPQWDLTEIAQQTIRTEPLVVILPSTDELASESTATLPMLAGRSFIAPQVGTTARYWFDRMFTSAAIEPHVAVETNEIAAMQAYVKLGMGVAITPRSVVPPAVETVVAVPLTGFPELQIVLAWHETGYRTPAAQKALAFTREAARLDSANASETAPAQRQ